jgi:ADP-dependent NAD(P)H-hydrate dehydratase / NAD(P)H-hydrate epimerase
MAAEAAARAGAGLVSVATRSEHVPAFISRCPELMVNAVDDASTLAPLLNKATTIVIGPGLGQTDWSLNCLQTTLDNQTGKQQSFVIDADALNLLSKNKVNLPVSKQFILTPHPGEASRLLGCSCDEVKTDREDACLKLQQKYGGISLLKGAATLIASEESGRVMLESCSHGNPGMGSGGMGDILSGVLGGLLAQGFSLADSTRLGVCIHSLSADLAAAETGERGLMATDLLPYIHKLVNNG